MREVEEIQEVTGRYVERSDTLHPIDEVFGEDTGRRVLTASDPNHRSLLLYRATTGHIATWQEAASEAVFSGAEIVPKTVLLAHFAAGGADNSPLAVTKEANTAWYNVIKADVATLMEGLTPRQTADVIAAAAAATTGEAANSQSETLAHTNPLRTITNLLQTESTTPDGGVDVRPPSLPMIRDAVDMLRGARTTDAAGVREVHTLTTAQIELIDTTFRASYRDANRATLERLGHFLDAVVPEEARIATPTSTQELTFPPQHFEPGRPLTTVVVAGVEGVDVDLSLSSALLSRVIATVASGATRWGQLDLLGLVEVDRADATAVDVALQHAVRQDMPTLLVVGKPSDPLRPLLAGSAVAAMQTDRPQGTYVSELLPPVPTRKVQSTSFSRTGSSGVSNTGTVSSSFSRHTTYLPQSGGTSGSAGDSMGYTETRGENVVLGEGPALSVVDFTNIPPGGAVMISPDGRQHDLYDMASGGWRGEYPPREGDQSPLRVDATVGEEPDEIERARIAVQAALGRSSTPDAAVGAVTVQPAPAHLPPPIIDNPGQRLTALHMSFRGQNEYSWREWCNLVYADQLKRGATKLSFADWAKYHGGLKKPQR